MSRFLVLYSAPAAVIDEWKKTPAEKRKEPEEKMMRDWRNWMADHAMLFADKGAGVGKTKRITAQGIADTRNDIMLYAIVEAESHDAATRAFEGHPHFGIPQASIEVMQLNALPGTEGK
jgi:hypothetical protein